MKTIHSFLCLTLSLLFSFSLQAKNYYVSATGNDANDGLTTSTPWQTIAKINSTVFASGDVVLFKRGDSFFGGITVSGSNTSFNAYGTGALPVVSGFAALTSWTSQGSGIWKCNLPAAGNSLKVVTINGQMQRMGRWPNYNRTDGGWLSYENVTVFPGITDNQLTSLSSNNWTGAEVAIKKYSYVIDHCAITSQSGNTLNYAYATDLFATNANGTPGYGYFIQNDLRTLDVFGEWFLNKTTKDLYVYFGSNDPTSYTVQAAIKDVLFDCGVGGYMGGVSTTAYTNISVNNIDFEGANMTAYNSFNGSSNSISGCTINNCYNGIFFWNVAGSTSTGNTITNVLNDAIYQDGQVSSPTTITNNTIRNVGLFEGMGSSSEGGTYSGINQGGDNTTISGNIIDSVGLSGIHFQGANVLVQHNFVNHHGMKLDDYGGIYTYNEQLKLNRVVDGNIVVNGIGCRQGRTENDTRTYAYYADGASRNIIYSNNTSAFEDAGDYLGNSNQYITLTGNTFYGSPIGIWMTRYPNDAASPGYFARNLRITQNIIYPTETNFFYWNGQLNQPTPITIQADIQAIGTMDSNYYKLNSTKQWKVWSHDIAGGTFNEYIYTTLASWRSFIAGDVNSDTISRAANTFQYNASNSAITYSFTGFSKKDPQGKVYNNSAVIPAWSSKILIDNGSVTNILPILTIGNYQSITLPTATTTITGSATDPDGIVTKYAWSKIAGPATGAIATPDAAVTVLNNLVQGIYKFELIVTDNNGGISKDSLQVTVYAAINQAPVANAGADKSVTLPANSVTLSGGGTDVDGTIANYNWTKTAGPANGTIVTPTTATTSVSNLVQGTYVFELAVTDNSGVTSKDSLQVTVYPVINQAPVANAGADKSVTLPTNSVTVSGSGKDADGIIASYTWEKISGPSGGRIVTAYASSTTIKNLAIGSYKYALTVKDNKGLYGKDTMQVTVIGSSNKIVITNAGTSETVLLPTTTTTLCGTPTTANTSIGSYSWTKIEGPATAVVVDSSSAFTTVKNLSKGNYKYEFTMRDSERNSAKDTVSIIVETDNSGNNNSMRVYPNPVMDIANLEINTIASKEINSVSVLVIGSTGTIVARQNYKISGSNNHLRLGLSNLITGVYIVQAVFPNGKTCSTKVIKLNMGKW